MRNAPTDAASPLALLDGVTDPFVDAFIDHQPEITTDDTYIGVTIPEHARHPSVGPPPALIVPASHPAPAAESEQDAAGFSVGEKDGPSTAHNVSDAIEDINDAISDRPTETGNKPIDPEIEPGAQDGHRASHEPGAVYEDEAVTGPGADGALDEAVGDGDQQRPTVTGDGDEPKEPAVGDVARNAVSQETLESAAREEGGGAERAAVGEGDEAAGEVAISGDPIVEVLLEGAEETVSQMAAAAPMTGQTIDDVTAEIGEEGDEGKAPVSDEHVEENREKIAVSDELVGGDREKVALGGDSVGDVIGALDLEWPTPSGALTSAVIGEGDQGEPGVSESLGGALSDEFVSEVTGRPVSEAVDHLSNEPGGVAQEPPAASRLLSDGRVGDVADQGNVTGETNHERRPPSDESVGEVGGATDQEEVRSAGEVTVSEDQKAADSQPGRLGRFLEEAVAGISTSLTEQDPQPPPAEPLQTIDAIVMGTAAVITDDIVHLGDIPVSREADDGLLPLERIDDVLASIEQAGDEAPVGIPTAAERKETDAPVEEPEAEEVSVSVERDEAPADDTQEHPDEALPNETQVAQEPVDDILISIEQAEADAADDVPISVEEDESPPGDTQERLDDIAVSIVGDEVPPDEAQVLPEAVDYTPDALEQDTVGPRSPAQGPDAEEVLVSVEAEDDAQEHPGDIPVSVQKAEALLAGRLVSLEKHRDEQTEANAPHSLSQIDNIPIFPPDDTQVSLYPVEQPKEEADNIRESVEQPEAVEQPVFEIDRQSVADEVGTAVEHSDAVVPIPELSEEEEEAQYSEEVGLLVCDVVHEVTPPSTSPRGNPRHISSSPPYTDDDLHHLYERMMRTKRSPDPSAIPPLRRWVAREMRAAAFDGRYDQGARLEMAELMLEDFVMSDQSGYLREQHRLHAVKRLAEWRSRYERTVREYAEKIAGWRQSQSERAVELEELHRQQIELFERQWADPSFLMQFNKPSPHVLSLRQIEQNLAFAKQFHRAKTLKIEATRLEKQEAILARQRAIMVMKQEFVVLEAKQQREVECLNEFTKRIQIAMEQKRDGVLAAMDLVIQRLSGIVNPRKERERTKAAMYRQQGPPPMPRPMRNVDSGRTLKPRTLELTGIQMRQFIKVKKAPRRPMSEQAAETV
jgi:hypothetical protein